jgi:hypothetical protein
MRDAICEKSKVFKGSSVRNKYIFCVLVFRVVFKAVIFRYLYSTEHFNDSESRPMLRLQ